MLYASAVRACEPVCQCTGGEHAVSLVVAGKYHLFPAPLNKQWGLVMSGQLNNDVLRWYAIHTKPNQENRAEHNLRSWNVETFAPKFRRRCYRRYNGAETYVI